MPDFSLLPWPHFSPGCCSFVTWIHHQQLSMSRLSLLVYPAYSPLPGFIVSLPPVTLACRQRCLLHSLPALGPFTPSWSHHCQDSPPVHSLLATHRASLHAPASPVHSKTRGTMCSRLILIGPCSHLFIRPEWQSSNSGSCPRLNGHVQFISPYFSNIIPKDSLHGVREVLFTVIEHLDVLSTQLLCTFEPLCSLCLESPLFPPLPPCLLSTSIHPSKPIQRLPPLQSFP